MPPKKNPLNLNPLQLKTLTLMQYLATLPGHRTETDDGIQIGHFPQPHGNHFHLGHAVVETRDATGLGNQAVWAALERKGLIKSTFPVSAIITPDGLAYDTGLRDQILHQSNH
ncbi:MAG: hypothetical protein QOJ54_813 [Aliidongia sp.]|nr:hypothetical protein [Aliidongia sp.]